MQGHRLQSSSHALPPSKPEERLAALASTHPPSMSSISSPMPSSPYSSHPSTIRTRKASNPPKVPRKAAHMTQTATTVASVLNKFTTIHYLFAGNHNANTTLQFPPRSHSFFSVNDSYVLVSSTRPVHTSTPPPTLIPSFASTSPVRPGSDHESRLVQQELVSPHILQSETSLVQQELVSPNFSLYTAKSLQPLPTVNLLSPPDFPPLPFTLQTAPPKPFSLPQVSAKIEAPMSVLNFPKFPHNSPPNIRSIQAIPVQEASSSVFVLQFTLKIINGVPNFRIFVMKIIYSLDIPFSM